MCRRSVRALPFERVARTRARAISDAREVTVGSSVASFSRGAHARAHRTSHTHARLASTLARYGRGSNMVAPPRASASRRHAKTARTGFARTIDPSPRARRASRRHAAARSPFLPAPPRTSTRSPRSRCPPTRTTARSRPRRPPRRSREARLRSRATLGKSPSSSERRPPRGTARWCAGEAPRTSPAVLMISALNLSVDVATRTRTTARTGTRTTTREPP